MTCEKCWADACQRALRRGRTLVDEYHALLAERRASHLCSPREQAGQFWDDDRQVDRRLREESA